MKINWDQDCIEIEGLSLKPDEVIEKLTDFVSEERRYKIDKVLKGRSSYFVPVMENLLSLIHI